ncbi:hypothetical protein Nepgr_000147 [Nepenthes gracilis]|uniref:JAB1/MPN/MOV34 metalloenzyme domain-containing protein n=1 Tax=Nepenthes gracilis TaxID=150966 RepID=A0AAD3RWK8_NEPGR|nr:hypothetical protein Nepgr_000147 [Nepenthes gracilis]
MGYPCTENGIGWMLRERKNSMVEFWEGWDWQNFRLLNVVDGFQFSSPSGPALSVKVHPVVIFNICNCYIRRPDQAERVIGTLGGSVLPDGTVDVRNSLEIPDQLCCPTPQEHMQITVCSGRTGIRGLGGDD